ncbi:class I SAM-dependent DNA methyltransferase [Streptomyces sp. NPDC048172]|uniref:class I SAM-dependent DNA methyltransferase n=1 Tax=Streptomyces sp. NPDC048172 TaxID=3365505 RepID=UPI0037186027
MYGEEFSTIYDAVYSLRGKDYPAEAAFLTETVRSRAPGAASLLDVGCGTGSHLVHFAEDFGHVEGLDYVEDMLTVAKGRLPDVPLHHGDMRSFDLGRRFDALVCLFGTVGHAWTHGELRDTFACFARHLEPGGVVAVDPWWFTERFIDGYVSADVISPDGTSIARVSHTRRDGDVSRMEVHYVVANAADGARHFQESYTHRLFSRAEYEQALREAGFDFDYIDGVQSGRGLFVATHAPTSRKEQA